MPIWQAASAVPEVTTSTIAAAAATIPKRLPERFIACSFSPLPQPDMRLHANFQGTKLSEDTAILDDMGPQVNPAGLKTAAGLTDQMSKITRACQPASRGSTAI